jgi:VanZ family protein
VLKYFLLVITICYTLVLGFVSLATFSSLPEIGTGYDDKIFHCLAYGVLFLLWYFTLNSLKAAKPIFSAIIVSLIYGIIIEVLQGQITTNRQLDVFDAIANLVGITIAALFVIFRNRRIVKNL